MIDGPESLAGALARLEPDSGWEGCAHDAAATPDLRVRLSIAISLKRIADALDGTTLGVDISDSIAGLTLVAGAQARTG